MTHLCVPIFVRDLARTKRDIAAAAEAGADMVELRIDPLRDYHILAEILRDSILPAIVTCRPDWEGGLSPMEDPERITLLMTCVEDGAQIVDLELKTARRYEHIFRQLHSDDKDHPTVILSHHDFTGRPEKLYNIISDLNAMPVDVNKIVWTARTIRDNLEAFELLVDRRRPTIALCMGEAGVISRILAKKFGAFLTFAALDAESATAPGQISIVDMKRLYRWDSIGTKTKVYGVVANPVGHSMSPAIHNAAFDATGFDGIYLPLLVDGSYESFKAFMETFANFAPLDLSGLSVTIPHKGHALRYLKEKGATVEDLAASIGAVNTISIDDDRKLSGYNTDYLAILDSIAEKLGIDRTGLKGLRISVIGAGGTGRTAVAALAHFGTEILVCNRTADRAAALAAEFDGNSGSVSAVSLEDISQAPVDVVINTTSVGMFPNIDESPAPDLRLEKNTVVFDTVYNPPKTKLLEQAEAAGCPTIGGIEMFVRQAAGQFELWTGKPAPVEVMRRVIEERLGK